MVLTATVLPSDQYRLLVEHSPVLLWRSGTDAKCDYFNEIWLRFTGRTLEQELGDGWSEGVHPDDFEPCVKHYLTHFEARKPFEMVYRLRRHDGVYRYVFDRGVPYEGSDGKFAGFIGSCVDVHEREESKRVKASFLSMMAHEQRTPLSALKMFVTSMAFRAKHGEPITEDMFGRLNGQIDRFARLVDLLAETARLEEGRALSVSLEPLDLTELVSRVIGFRAETMASRSEHAQRKHQFSYERGGRPCPVLGDALRLEQVVINVIDNAVKYSPDGGVIAVEVVVVGGRAQFSVTDSGIGIPSDDLPRITQRYFRARNASPDHFPGLGLGLSLCREIVEQHGGSMSLSSNLGAGTTVRFELPVLTATV